MSPDIEILSSFDKFLIVECAVLEGKITISSSIASISKTVWLRLFISISKPFFSLSIENNLSAISFGFSLKLKTILPEF